MTRLSPSQRRFGGRVAYAIVTTLMAATAGANTHLQVLPGGAEPPEPTCQAPSYAVQESFGESQFAITAACYNQPTPWAAFTLLSPRTCHLTKDEADNTVLNSVAQAIAIRSMTGHRYAQLQVLVQDWSAVNQNSSNWTSKRVLVKYCAPGPTARANAWKDAGGNAPGRGACEAPGCKVRDSAPTTPTTFANPIQPGTGNKVEHVLDYRGPGDHPLVIERTYNSGTGVLGGPWGQQWSGQYLQRLVLRTTGSGSYAAVIRPNGRTFFLTKSGTTYLPDPDLYIRLDEASGGGYTLTLEDDLREDYDASGRLLSIRNRAGQTITAGYDAQQRLASATDAFGRTLLFGYDAAGRIATITDPAGGQYGYQYDANGNLVKVTYPDARERTYHYELPTQPYALTGITDENGVRFATFGYDARGFANLSEHAGGVQRYTFSYPSGTDTPVTDALGTTRTLRFTNSSGSMLPTSTTGFCRDCGPFAATTYNGAGKPASQTDWNGVVTQYTHDSRGLLTTRIEAAGRPEERRTTIEWHATFRLPTRIAEPKRLTTNVYDPDGATCGARGALCSRTIQATTDLTGAAGTGANLIGGARTWSYTYNGSGKVLSVNGPRTDLADLTTFTYDPQGNLTSVTNALGHTTQITSYNGHGQPLSVTDANGVVSSMIYDVRQRLTSRTMGSETTQYTYRPSGELSRVTMPDGSFIQYGYDAAQRLVNLADNLGNRIVYTLDAVGNRTREDVYDPANTLTQTRQRIFDGLSRLAQEIGAQGQTTSYAYDAQGNVTGITDPLNRQTTQSYDGRNRLLTVTDPAAGITRYAYDGLDQLAAVTDPRNLSTLYTRTGLGDLEFQSSPDTGVTSNSFDAAGNLVFSTDAKNQQTVTQYDALNRVTEVVYADGLRHAYAYDQGAFGQGRLASITEYNGANQLIGRIAYSYDNQGRVVAETRTIAGVVYTTQYVYDAAGRMLGTVYPSGRQISHALDGLSRIAAMATNVSGQPATVLTGAGYQPLGGVKSFAYGNGATFARSFDQDGRIQAYALDGAMEVIGFDPASRITSIARSGTQASYGYDNLGRLVTAAVPGANYSFAYDPTGNRTTKATSAGADSYLVQAASNRLESIALAGGGARNFTHDPNGAVLADGGKTFAYDARGRMTLAYSPSAGSLNFALNALGERVRKTSATSDTVFHYDRGGRLIGESDAAGGFRREYLWLGGTPVAVVARQSDPGTSCPATPTVDTSGTFAGFDPGERLLARGGNSGPGGPWEWQLTAAGGAGANGQFSWVNARPYAFTLTYAGNGQAALVVRDAGTPVLTLNLPAGMDTGNAVRLAVSSSANLGIGARIVADITSIDGAGVTQSLATPGNNQAADIGVVLVAQSLTDGFAVQGTLTMHFAGTAPPSGARLAFEVQAGNVLCSSPPITTEALHYIHPDHLDTPRLVTDGTGQARWRWVNSEPFGDNAPDENPAGAGPFVFNLRFPGQYYDAELGTAYNYYRDYDPSIGRYTTSDPIGLLGGVNTYAYVHASPLGYSDSLGLYVGDEAAYARAATAVGSGTMGAAAAAAAVSGAFLGGLAVGTAIYDKWGTEIQDALEAACRPGGAGSSSGPPPQHRGAIQFQGSRTRPAVQESSSWAQQTPPTKAEGFAHLHAAYTKVQPSQRPRFTNAVGRAARFITQATGVGVGNHSFANNPSLSNVIGTDRVDIDIKSGWAF